MSDRWATKVVAQVDLNLLSQGETAVLGYLSKMILAPVTGDLARPNGLSGSWLLDTKVR